MSTFNQDRAADADLARQAQPQHGIPSQDPTPAAQVGLRPEEAERESKSALVGGGAMAGLVTGAATGAVVGGPLGVLVGGTIGTLAGALGGEAAGSLMPPEPAPDPTPAAAAGTGTGTVPPGAAPLPAAPGDGRPD